MFESTQFPYFKQQSYKSDTFSIKTPSYIPSKAFHSLAFKGKRGYTKVFLKNQLDPQQQNKTYGGIISVNSINGPVKYALVQGRYTGKWSFPKGHIHEGETSAQCSFREICEETGIDLLPEPAEYIKIGYGHYYVFKLDKEIPLIPNDINEIIDAKWVTIEEMGELPLNADTSLFRKQQVLYCDSFKDSRCEMGTELNRLSLH